MNRPDHDARERELAALDRLLDTLPDPQPPAGLAERVLAATAAERAARAPRRSGRLLTFAGLGAGLAAAAALLLWFARPQADDRSGPARPGPDPFGPGPTRVASVEADPGAEAQSAPLPAPAELLAELELLEEWELLVPEDLDLLLADLDELDELLLELPTASDPGADDGEEG